MPVSVIITIYNTHLDFLKSAIDSVLRQSFRDFEVIIIDDGSEPPVGDFIRGWDELMACRTQYLWQPNAGAAVAKNAGIKRSKGCFIAFLDSDDVFCPDKIERCHHYLSGRKDLGMVFSDMDVIDTDGNVVGNWLGMKPHAGEGMIYENLLRQCFIIPSNSFIRRDVFGRVGLFRQKYGIAHDYDFWLRASRLFEIGMIKEVLSQYRLHGCNLSKQEDRIRDNIICILEEQLKNAKVNDAVKMAVRRRLARQLYHHGASAFYQGNNQTARLHFVKSFTHQMNFGALMGITASLLPTLVSRGAITLKRWVAKG